MTNLPFSLEEIFWTETKRDEYLKEGVIYINYEEQTAYISERDDVLLKIRPYMGPSKIVLNNNGMKILTEFWVQFGKFSRYYKHHKDKIMMIDVVKMMKLKAPERENDISTIEERMIQFTGSCTVN